MELYECPWGGIKNASQKYVDSISKFKYKCKCGHIVVITNRENKKICSWCGKYVFTNKKDEFIYKMRGCL